jgi:predicted Zn-dependent protease
MSRVSVIARIIAAGLVAVFVAAPQISRSQQARADAEKDPVLKAMLAELDRSMSQLQLPGFSKPFFIQYRIEEVDEFETKAAYGASEGSTHSRERVARVTVRMGDYKTDSSNERGDGSLELAGMDDDPVALRSALWRATDEAYKAALAAYAQKQAALKQVQTPPQADDFSHEKPVVSLAGPVQLVVDENGWAQRVARASGLYRSDSSVKDDASTVQYSTSSFRGRAKTTWLVNSEGTIVRKTVTEFDETFGVGTQADDGMRLDRSFASTGPALSDLDSEDKFNRRAVEEILSLRALRKAPVVEEEYHGPLLLSADAGADTMMALVGSGVTATRPKLGTEARTNGPFASSYQARVLPEGMDVVDDPGLTNYDGKDLLGAYAVDDEGVPAEAVKLIQDGRLTNYLIGRQPVKDFPQSNGHGRAALTGAPRPTIGVLKVTAKNGLSDDELNQKLLAMAKDRGLTSVYFVQTLGGELAPRLLYRVHVDGTRELVRGAELDDVDQRALRSSVVAAGKNLWVANYFADVPQTVLAPALLLDDATVRRANEKNDKLPFYPPPE